MDRRLCVHFEMFRKYVGLSMFFAYFLFPIIHTGNQEYTVFLLRFCFLSLSQKKHYREN
jgi:hypothetical protein